MRPADSLSFMPYPLFFSCGDKALSEVQATIPGYEGKLSALPGTVHVEPGELGKRGLSGRHYTPAHSADPVLAFSLSWNYLPIEFLRVEAKIRAGHFGRLVDAQYSKHRRGDIAQRAFAELYHGQLVIDDVKGDGIRG